MKKWCERKGEWGVRKWLHGILGLERERGEQEIGGG